MACDFVEQQICRYLVGCECEYQQLAGIRIEVEYSGTESVGSGGCVVCQSHVPYHASQVPRLGCLKLAALCHAFEPSRCYRCDIRVGVALEQLSQYGVEVLRFLFGDKSQGVEEHEFGHDFAKRITRLHFLVSAVYFGIAVFKISLICAVVQFLLHAVHVAQVVKIFRIAQGHAVARLREVGKNQVPVFFRRKRVAHTHVHQIQIVICIKAIDIVRIIGKQTVEFVACRIEILEFVFQDNAHVIQSFLYHVVGSLPFLVALWYLCEIIFRIMRVGSVFEFFAFLVGKIVFRLFAVLAVGIVFAAIFPVGIRGVEIGGVECGLVAAAPVVLEFS